MAENPLQQELLSSLGGSQVEVPIGSNQKNALTPLTTVMQSYSILFILSAAVHFLPTVWRITI